MYTREIFTFFNKKIDKKSFVKLIFVMFIVNLLDVLSLSLFIPIIEIFQNDVNSNSAIASFLSSIIINLGFEPGLPIFLAIISIVFIVKAFFAFLLRYMSVYQASLLQHELRMSLIHGYTFSNIDFIHGHKQGVLLSTIGEHVNRTSNVYFLFSQILVQVLTVAVVLVFLYVISWELTLVSISFSLLLVPILKWVGKKTYVYGKKHAQNFENLTHSSYEILQAKKQISAMHLQPEVTEKFNLISNKVRQSWLWMAFFSNSPAHFVQPFAVIILSIIILLASTFNLTIALTGAFIMAYIRLLPSLQSALAISNDIRSAIPSIQRVASILSESNKSIEYQGISNFFGIKKSIIFKNISFNYESEKVLNCVNLTIRKGEMIAIVGESGSGKTTLVDILIGLRRTSSGSLLIDNTDINKINLKEYRERIAYVPQDTILFNDTIYNNLIMGVRHDVDRDKVESVCRLIGAWGFISKKNNGLDSKIGDLGSSLSGGQKQRLALVRALLREPDLLILDEATSSLDSDTENIIKEAIFTIRQNTDITIVIIAHRYTTIENADRIYRLSNGSIQNLGRWSKASLLLNKERV
jgi:ABC-type multidrug transport system fused ATPase/permease subunit